MSEKKSRIEQEVEKLATARDELRVQIDLGKKDLGDAWHDLEKKWSKLEGHARRLKKEGESSLGEIEEAASLLAEEVRDGFKKLRALL